MRRYVISVEQTIIVTLDETKFTPAFFDDFNAMIGDIGDIDEHAVNLAGQSVHVDTSERFIEGYGPMNAMGIQIEEDVCFSRVEETEQL